VAEWYACNLLLYHVARANNDQEMQEFANVCLGPCQFAFVPYTSNTQLPFSLFCQCFVSPPVLHRTDIPFDKPVTHMPCKCHHDNTLLLRWLSVSVESYWSHPQLRHTHVLEVFPYQPAKTDSAETSISTNADSKVVAATQPIRYFDCDPEISRSPLPPGSLCYSWSLDELHALGIQTRFCTCCVY
jgi:hypothetical protein